MEFSERYQKALVTVAIGLRTEEDIRGNGLYRFVKTQKAELIDYITKLFEKKQNLLVLKVKKTGYRSEHINVSSQQDFNNLIANIDDVFGIDNEIWVVSSSVTTCWRCRIYLSADISMQDRVEMALSTDDHILDHIGADNVQVPYVCFQKSTFNNKLEVTSKNVDGESLKQCEKIIADIFSKFSYDFRQIKTDIELLNIPGISLDCRVNNGYDFHDFDVSYGDVKKIIDFYVPMYIKKHYGD